MREAIQLFVRGFYEHDTGDVICKRLREIGFEISFCTVEDDRGGYIETRLALIDSLTLENINEIKEAIYSSVPAEPAVFVQWREYELVFDSEADDE